MITERDQIAYDFLKTFRMAKIDQINRVAYDNYKVCARRMKKLQEDGLLFKRTNTIEQGILYGFDKVNLKSMRNYHHTMAVNETYIAFLDHTEVEEVKVEKMYGSIQPDMLIRGYYDDEPYFYLVEVETEYNSSKPNYNKYNRFLVSEWRDYFDEKPVVLYVTSKEIDDDSIEYDYKVTRIKLGDFEEMLDSESL